MATRSMVRRDPYVQDILDFRRNFDEIFSRFFGADSASSGGRTTSLIAWVPPIESYLEQNRYHVRLALPGIKPEDVDVQVLGGEIVISGERRREEENTTTTNNYLQRELVYGLFERAIPLPEGTQPDKIEARFQNGILDITVPLSEQSLPRRIPVTSETGKQLSGQTRQTGQTSSKKVA